MKCNETPTVTTDLFHFHALMIFYARHYRIFYARHYRISILRRVPQAHGEAPRAHGEDFAEGRARRSADGNYRHDKG